MYTYNKTHRPLFSHPIVAGLVLTLGMSVLAFGAYLTEKPAALTTSHRMMAATPMPLDVPAPKVEAAVEVTPAPPEIVLDEMRIVAPRAHRARAAYTSADDCRAADWHSLSTGPVTREVREFCGKPVNASTPILSKSTRAGASNNERLMMPRNPHGRVGAVETPAAANSLGELLPAT